jgi:hypothetical protein
MSLDYAGLVVLCGFYLKRGQLLAQNWVVEVPGARQSLIS